MEMYSGRGSIFRPILGEIPITLEAAFSGGSEGIMAGEWASGATALVAAMEAYGWTGLVVAAGFLLVGIDRIDPSARGSYAFRVAVFPGVVALWPVVLIRWGQLEIRRSRQ